MKSIKLLFSLSGILACFLLSMLGCTPLTPPAGLEKAVSDIQLLYGGEIEYAWGTNHSSTNGKQFYLEIALENSLVLDSSFRDFPELPISNMAWVVYMNTYNQPKHFSSITSAVIFGDGETYSATYNAEELKMMRTKMFLLEQTVQLFQTGKYDWIRSVVDTTLFPYEIESMIKAFPEVDAEMGKVQRFEVLGFEFLELEGKDYIKIIGHLMRESGYHPYHLAVGTDLMDEAIISMNFEY
ncbi:MAG: hypothetical protein AAF598_17085 [Bacteroidota bacterium]